MACINSLKLIDVFPARLVILNRHIATVDDHIGPQLSLGIPIYGYHWFVGEPNKPEPGKEEKPNPLAEYIGQPEVEQYEAAYHPHVEWDADDRVSWFYFYRDDEREWVFYTDKRGFQERLNLVRDRGLQGFCSWALGPEDPEIWSLLPSHK